MDIHKTSQAWSHFEQKLRALYAYDPALVLAALAQVAKDVAGAEATMSDKELDLRERIQQGRVSTHEVGIQRPNTRPPRSVPGATAPAAVDAGPRSADPPRGRPIVCKGHAGT